MGFCLKLFPMIHFHNVAVSTLFSLLPLNGNQCSDHWNPSWICISNSKSKFKSKIKIKFQYIQTIFKFKPTLEKSSMKSKIEFKYDIRKQNVKYPSYLENMKARSKQVYFTKKIFKV